MINFSLKNKKGFTLVEMMVAIAVFSVVMVTAMSALLNVIDANNKARAIKIAVDNVSFALEGISKDMRMGTDYRCLDDAGNPVTGTCASTGYKGVQYTKSGNIIKYFYTTDASGKGKIQKNINSTGPQNITSSEVDIKNMKFYVLNVEYPTDNVNTQPRMIMTLTGEAGGNKDKIKTDFDLQTSVSQRIRPSTL